jgi:hypothetical protein
LSLLYLTAGAAFLLHLTAGATPVELKHLTPLESAGNQRPQSDGAASAGETPAETPAESPGKQRPQQLDAVLLSQVSLNSSRASSSSCAPQAQTCDAAASQVFFFVELRGSCAEACGASAAVSQARPLSLRPHALVA